MLGRLRKDCRVARETRETREKAALRQSKAEIGVLGALLRVAVGELLRNVYAANQFGIFARPVFRVFRVFRGPLGNLCAAFSDSRDDLTPDAAELAQAIDDYKLRHRRRFINFEEMLHVVQSLGYRK